jgi:hypothetical protein
MTAGPGSGEVAQAHTWSTMALATRRFVFPISNMRPTMSVVLTPSVRFTCIHTEFSARGSALHGLFMNQG